MPSSSNLKHLFLPFSHVGLRIQLMLSDHASELQPSPSNVFLMMTSILSLKRLF